MVRLLVAVLVVASLVGAPAADAETIAADCPAYVAQLQSARAALVRGDRTSAITSLRGAQTALADCIRRDSDEAGARVLLAALPAPRPAAQ